MTIANKLEIAAACILGGGILGFFVGLKVADLFTGTPPMPAIADYGSPQLSRANSYAPEFCSGAEDFCVVTASAMPAETLSRLIEALPDKAPGPVRSIRLSVVSTESYILLPSPPTSIPLKEPPS